MSDEDSFNLVLIMLSIFKKSDQDFTRYILMQPGKVKRPEISLIKIF